MDNLVFLANTYFRGAEDNWVYNLVLKEDKFIIRVWVPKNTFNYSQMPEIIFTEKTDLLTDEYFFNDEVCNHRYDEVITTTIEEQEYILLYESHLTIDNVKNSGNWHPGALCAIYLPILSRIYTYPGYFSDITSISWYEDVKETMSYDEYAARVSRLNRIECIARFSVLDENSNFTNAPVILNFPEGHKLITNFDISEDTSLLGNSRDINVDPSILMVNYEVSTAENVKAGENAEITVQAKYLEENYSANSELTIEMQNGYTPKKLVAIENGTGTFSVKALDLIAGDTLKFRILDHGRACKEVSIPVI